jgi:hypothetical protein
MHAAAAAASHTITQVMAQTVRFICKAPRKDSPAAELRENTLGRRTKKKPRHSRHLRR